MKVYELLQQSITDESLRPSLKEYLPSGSGFDTGTTVSYDESTPTFIVLYTSFHKMDENGYYDGWVDLEITVKPQYSKFDLEASPTHYTDDEDDLLDYVYDTFQYALNQDVNE